MCETFKTVRLSKCAKSLVFKKKLHINRRVYLMSDTERKFVYVWFKFSFRKFQNRTKLLPVKLDLRLIVLRFMKGNDQS